MSKFLNQRDQVIDFYFVHNVKLNMSKKQTETSRPLLNAIIIHALNFVTGKLAWRGQINRLI